MNPFLAGGALAGFGAAIVGFWNQLKAVVWKLVSIVVAKSEISTEDAYEAVTAYLVRDEGSEQDYHGLLLVQ